MRKLAGYIIALLLPLQVYALGVGDIEWFSALNEPLRAEVKLFSMGTVRPTDITVKLAPYATFEKEGIEFPSVLRNLKFTVETKPGTDDTYIKITSRQAIQDPFLDMLVEIDWPNGHLLREYTVLLDLPATTDDAPGMISAPQTVAPAAVIPGRLDILDQDRVETADVTTPGTSQADAMTGRAVTRTQATTAQVDDLYYGMVKRGDTLWGIAEKMRKDTSISIQQMMLALLKHNPDAFYDNNINNLKAGYVLRMPKPAMLTDFDKRTAAREAERHYQEWKQKKGALARGPSAKTPAQQTVGVGDQAGEAGTRLKLVSPDAEEMLQATRPGLGTDQLGDDLVSLRKELASALKESDSSRQENSELREKIIQLEEQIAKMQRLVTLRDDALAVLQAKQADSGVTGTTTKEPVIDQAAMDQVPLEQAMTDMAPDQTPDQTIEPSVEPTAEQPVEKVTAAEDPAVEKTPPPVQTPVPPPVKAAPAKPAPVQKPSSVMDYVDQLTQQATQIANDLLKKPDMMAAIGGGVLLLGGIFWFLRKRRLATADLEESMLIEVADKELSDRMDSGAGSADDDLSDIEDVLSGNTSKVSAIEADDEIDILAEADVYLAYQRFDRAEELLTDAIKQEPERADYQLKLLEVLKGNNEHDKFVAAAEEFHQRFAKKHSGMWSKVVAMGQKVAPSHELFSNVDAAVTEAEDDTLPGGDLDFEDLGDDDFLAGLDFDLDSDTDTEVKKNEPASSEPAVAEDIGSLDMGGSDEHGLDMAMDFGDTASPSELPTEADTVASDDSGLNFDMSELEENPESAPPMESVAEDNLSLDMSADVGLSMDMTPADTAGGDDALSFDMAEETEIEVSEVPATVEETDDSLSFDMDLADDSSALATAESEDTSALTMGLDLADDSSEEISFGDTTSDESDFDISALEGSGEQDTGSEDLSFADIASGSSDESIDDDLASDIDWLSNVSDDAGAEEAESLFAGEDEVATKLDLIRAYIDMGDKDSARTILHEVVDEGSDDQKQEAQELLTQIG